MMLSKSPPVIIFTEPGRIDTTTPPCCVFELVQLILGSPVVVTKLHVLQVSVKTWLQRPVLVSLPSPDIIRKIEHLLGNKVIEIPPGGQLPRADSSLNLGACPS